MTKVGSLTSFIVIVVAAIAAQAQCPPGVVCLPGANTCYLPSTAAVAVVTQSAPVADVVATTPHVRCIAGNSCGSGTICGSDGDGSYVVTNAHVTGTQIGRQIAIDCVSDKATKRVTGRTVMTGYSDSRMVDFSIVFVAGLSSTRYMPMLKTEPDSQPFATTGSPKCVWPQVTKPFNNPRSYGDGLLTGSPNAIGGQSGSAIYNSKGQQIALLTWSMNGLCAGQKTSKLWQVATTRNVLLADPRPQTLRELSDCETQARPYTAEGVFGSCELIESAENSVRPVTENTISNVVGANMDELPIWVVPGTPPKPEPDPQPDCPDCPECPKCPENCVELTPNEAALIQFLRSQETADRVAIDWVKMIGLIMEIIRLIQEGRS